MLGEAFANGTLIPCMRGRGALYLLTQSLPETLGNTVLLPAFHCPTMVDPVLATGRRVRFYDVDASLQPNLSSLACAMDDDVAAVLVPRYFGFPARLDRVRETLAGSDFVLIEDCAHSFLSATPMRLAGEEADAAIYSFWKLVPSLVGGGAWVRDPRLESLQRTRSLSLAARLRYLRGLVSSMRAALERRRHGVTPPAGEDDLLMPETRPSYPSVSDYPFDPVLATAGYPWPARSLLERADLAEICVRRRRNFAIALKMLAGVPGVEPVFDELPADVCPWAFPVVMGKRAEVDYRLRARGVPLFTFGETPHPVLKEDGNRFSISRGFSRNLFALAIHQQLSEHEVQHYCATITRFMEKHH